MIAKAPLSFGNCPGQTAQGCPERLKARCPVHLVDGDAMPGGDVASDGKDVVAIIATLGERQNNHVRALNAVLQLLAPMEIRSKQKSRPDTPGTGWQDHFKAADLQSLGPWRT